MIVPITIKETSYLHPSQLQKHQNFAKRGVSLTKEDKLFLDSFLNSSETIYSSAMRRSSVSIVKEGILPSLQNKIDSFAPSVAISEVLSQSPQNSCMSFKRDATWDEESRATEQSQSQESKKYLMTNQRERVNETLQSLQSENASETLSVLHRMEREIDGYNSVIKQVKSKRARKSYFLPFSSASEKLKHKRKSSPRKVKIKKRHRFTPTINMTNAEKWIHGA